MKHTVLASIVLLTLAQQLSSQDEKILLHVTSVEQGDATDYCSTGKCSAIRITVEGYTQDEDTAIQYVLDCVEIIANEPTPHVTARCARVHSHSDYMVKLGPDYIAFGDSQSS